MESLETSSEAYSPYGDWRVYRDSYRDYSDEYRASDSWTAIRIIEGAHYTTRTHQNLIDLTTGRRYDMLWPGRRVDITLRLRIFGKRKNGRLRPERWWASVQVGAGYRTIDGMLGIDMPKGTCVSLADATRQADASEELAALIQKTVRTVYADRENQMAVFRVVSKIPDRWNDPWPEGLPVVEPWGVVFTPLFGTLDGDLPGGQWVGFSWRRTYPAPHTVEWKKSVSLYRIHGWGGSSSCSPEEHERFEPLFPEWFPRPEKT